jgi:hypothetical protein
MMPFLQDVLAQLNESLAEKEVSGAVRSTQTATAATPPHIALLDPGFFCSGLLLATHATQRNNLLGLIAPDGGVYSNYI